MTTFQQMHPIKFQSIKEIVSHFLLQKNVPKSIMYESKKRETSRCS